MEYILIYHPRFSYSFQTDQVIYGPQGTYNSVTPNTFSLVNERIFRVTGSFSSAGVLAAIAFSKRDDSGAEDTSTCYGTGDCTGFSVTQTTGNQYVTSMFGATDTSGVIRALSFRWASMCKFIHKGIIFLFPEEYLDIIKLDKIKKSFHN